MRKNVFGRQFKRDYNERKALFKGLLTNLVLYERIQTTEAKAKAIRPAADKLVTKAKKGPSAQRFIEPKVYYSAVGKLLTDIGPRNANRNGGYTRLIRLGRRRTDGAPLALLEWTEQKVHMPVSVIQPGEKKIKTPKKPAKTLKLEATVKSPTKTKEKPTEKKSVKTKKK